jgi:hypothetical protein
MRLMGDPLLGLLTIGSTRLNNVEPRIMSFQEDMNKTQKVPKKSISIRQGIISHWWSLVATSSPGGHEWYWLDTGRPLVDAGRPLVDTGRPLVDADRPPVDHW